MKILFIKNEMGSRKKIFAVLRKEGYTVEAAYDEESGFSKAAAGDFDVIVLYLHSPNEDRVAFIRDLRDLGISTPLIVLGDDGHSGDKVAVLDAGADDCLVTPLDMDEFMARLRVLSRRRNQAIIENKLEAAGLVLDPLKCVVMKKNQTIKLSLKETLLLEILMRNTGKVVTREQLFDRVWGYCSKNELSNVDLYVYYLRKKLSKTSIGTVRGIGYFFEQNLDAV
ncbi:two component transcriptional regulator, winged helix family [Syntrophobotulus glycolicus DSM 8271]|uniref:Stage 0 sporulation protein A homolog n=1 Tax=Syntrophobotulus glycolicus (strain DSM 8271 / FlGlyR) TaxID=645991 RepID=F0SYB1_SYNGF|nr:response regulator transcription factor [Syntrophobotulus glycolicus]ADY55946.1 two component transcriptional regulator, winged helix family [Syntrophobotulus glycolicus DSM 8271]